MPSTKLLITDSFKVVKRSRRGRSKKTKDQEAEKKENGLRTVSQDKLDLDMLKQFDLTWEYGPCIGITRLQRWERAKLLGLDPPIKVKEAVLKHKEDPQYLNSLWHEYPL